MPRYRAPGGWTVEVIRSEGTNGNRDGEWLRVSQYGSWVADIRTPAELTQWFSLGDLEPDELSARYPHHAVARTRLIGSPVCGTRPPGARVRDFALPGQDHRRRVSPPAGSP